MSQAHYVRCGHMTPSPDSNRFENRDILCSTPAVVIMHMPYFLGNELPACLKHMTKFFDHLDDEEQKGNPFRHEEPTRLVWVYDAGTRVCPLHHWPDVVCADWGREHAAMIRQLRWTAPGLTLVKPPVPDPRSLSRG